MTSSEATGRSQSSCGHPGVVGDGTTRLVEPGPRLPDKLRCGQRRGERRFRQTDRPGEDRLVNRGRTLDRYGGVGDFAAQASCGQLPRRRVGPSSKTRRPARRVRGRRHARLAGSAPCRICGTLYGNVAGGKPCPLRGVPYTRPVKNLSGVPYTGHPFPPAAVWHRTPGSVRHARPCRSAGWGH